MARVSVLTPAPAFPRPDRVEPDGTGRYGATDTARGWIATLVVTLIAAFTRFFNLGSPTNEGTPVFDEKHYVPQAWQVLESGQWIEDNPGFGLIVHPPVGKWMIAIGEYFFGYTPTGWRFMSAVCGVVIVFLVVRIGRRLTRSTFIGVLAGIFVICDGVTFVSSRVGMLDIFVIFFVMIALAMILCDRDEMRSRMYRVATEGRIGDSAFGPRFGFRWWRFGAAIALGLTLGVKWSGLYFIAAFVIMSLGFDYATRRAFGVRKPLRGVLLFDVIPTGFVLGLTPIAVYLASWWPWFSSETSVYRYSIEEGWIGNGGKWAWVGNALRSLFHYQTSVLDFHEGLTNGAGNHHPWESKPWTWPMGLRPMLYHITTGEEAGMCGAKTCVKAEMLIGTPAMWWLAIPVVLWGLWRWLVRHDWRYAVVIGLYLMAFLPWFANIDRQMYFFYAVPLGPLLALGLALVMADILRWGTNRMEGRRDLPRLRGADADRTVDELSGKDGSTAFATAQAIVIIYTSLVVVNFLWLWPILTGTAISQHWWQLQMWLPSWR